jgi:hypothetical protein
MPMTGVRAHGPHQPPSVRIDVISFFSRPLRLVALVAVIGIAGGVYWVWNGAHSSTAVSQDGVLAEYRAKGVSDAPPAPGVPAPGVYRYRATGSESAGSGVLSASRSLPAEAVYVITPTEAGYHEDLRLSEEHVEEADFAVGERGASATWRRTKITFLGIGEDDRDAVEPPAFDHPSTFAVGRSWKGAYTLGDLRVSYTGRITGRETAQLDGKPVEVFVIRTDSTFRGSTPGTRTDVLRWSPDLSLPVAWSITQKTGGDADFAIDADLTLISGVPQR